MEAPTKTKKQTRRFTRASVSLPVTVASESTNFHCQGLQLSEFGILLGSEHKEAVGKVVQLKLELESLSRSLFLSGTVAYTIDKGFGIRFKGLSEEQRTVLKDYLKGCTTRIG